MCLGVCGPGGGDRPIWHPQFYGRPFRATKILNLSMLRSQGLALTAMNGRPSGAASLG